MRSPWNWHQRLVDLALAVGLLCAFLATIAPGLTWANDGVDGGDLITAAATGGVAHPTGYPTYLVIAKVFQLIPWGSLALRTNLLSALASMAAALTLSAIVREASRQIGQTASVLGGAVAGVSYGLAPLVWSQSVISEVYTLHCFFVALLVYLCITMKSRSAAKVFGIGLTMGIAAGNHVSSLLVAPAVMAVISFGHDERAAAQGSSFRNWRWDTRAFAIACLGTVGGLLIYWILPIRAAAHPPIDWGAPTTLPRLAWLVSGQLYQRNLVQFSPGILSTHVRSWAVLTVWQTGVVGLALALLGLIVFFKSSRVHLLALWMAFVFSAFAVQYTARDSYVYLLPLCVALSIGIGLAIAELTRLVSPHFPPAAWLIGFVALVYFIALGISRWQQVDASRDYRAELYGQGILAGAPPSAIIFAEGDQAVFTLWYFHYALKMRPDVAVVANSLLPFDWYRENLRFTYPDLSLPAKASGIWIAGIRDANPRRPSCFAIYPELDLKCP
jgi:Protein O-mannosyl-transferase TMEM260-like